MPGTEITKPSAEPKFVQGLGLLDSTMMVAGSMIGSGIFIVSADIARQVGSAGWLLGVWLVTGALTVSAALSYGELAAMMPQAGGQYVYLREAYSPLWGFLYGWTSFLVIQTGTIAAVAVAFAKYLGVLVPALGTRDPNRYKLFTEDPTVLWGVDKLNFKLTLPLPWLSSPLVVFERHEFTVTTGQLVGVGVILLLTWWNTRGLTGGKWLQNIFTVTKIGSLAALIAVGFALTYSPNVATANFADPWGGIAVTTRTQEIAERIPQSE